MSTPNLRAVLRGAPFARRRITRLGSADCTGECGPAQMPSGHPRRHVTLDRGLCAWIDEPIVDLVVALNRAGVTTVGSCQGYPDQTGADRLAFVALDSLDDWYRLLSRLYSRADRMGEGELELLHYIGGVASRVREAWYVKVFPRDPRSPDYGTALPGRTQPGTRLIPSPLLRFPLEDAATAADLLRAHA